MTDAEATRTLTLYTRRRCAMCEHLALGLDLMRTRHHFDLTKIDVDSDPALVERYGLRVPVLVDDGREISAGACDLDAVASYLTEN